VGEVSVTKTVLVIGSCAYMATERLSGKPGGPASDVFSAPPRPSIMRRGIASTFDDVIAKGMAKDPAAQYGSAGELARAAAVQPRAGGAAGRDGRHGRVGGDLGGFLTGGDLSDVVGQLLLTR
jgi:serine/threonine-protein kinase